jgi:hypothetical protein
MGMSSSNGVNGIPPWVRPGEGFTSLENDGIIKPSEREEVVMMPLYGLVKDSPVITAIQKTTRRGRKDAARKEQAIREIDASIYAYGKLFKGIARIFNIPIK